MSIPCKPEIQLKDKLGRTARYLRISITDRCNFDCFYCRDPRRNSYIPHENILRYEEISRFIGIMAEQGVQKIRITGGEPFARKNCTPFLYNLRKKFPNLRLNLTTNGVLLEPWIADLERIAPEAINISLDSFERPIFAKITGKDQLATVLSNIDKLLSKNIRVKLNAVALRGITDRELDNYINAIRQMPVDMRFIEFMPMGSNTRWSPEMFLPASELATLLREKVDMKMDSSPDPTGTAGPARMHKVKNAKGRFGFISALSDHFCGICNRLRLTSDGKLRTCLFSDREFQLAGMLRNRQVSNESIMKAVNAAHRNKPLGAEILQNKTALAVANKNMTGIGG